MLASKVAKSLRSHQRHAVVLSDAQGAQAPGGARGIGQDLRPAAEAIARSRACLHRFFPLPFFAAPLSMVVPGKVARRLSRH
jgi:hypothetical protein